MQKNYRLNISLAVVTSINPPDDIKISSYPVIRQEVTFNHSVQSIMELTLKPTVPATHAVIFEQPLVPSWWTAVIKIHGVHSFQIITAGVLLGGIVVSGVWNLLHWLSVSIPYRAKTRKGDESPEETINVVEGENNLLKIEPTKRETSDRNPFVSFRDESDLESFQNEKLSKESIESGPTVKSRKRWTLSSFTILIKAKVHALISWKEDDMRSFMIFLRTLTFGDKIGILIVISIMTVSVSFILPFVLLRNPFIFFGILFKFASASTPLFLLSAPLLLLLEILFLLTGTILSAVIWDDLEEERDELLLFSLPLSRRQYFISHGLVLVSCFVILIVLPSVVTSSLILPLISALRWPTIAEILFSLSLLLIIVFLFSGFQILTIIIIPSHSKTEALYFLSFFTWMVASYQLSQTTAKLRGTFGITSSGNPFESIALAQLIEQWFVTLENRPSTIQLGLVDTIIIVLVQAGTAFLLWIVACLLVKKQFWVK